MTYKKKTVKISLKIFNINCFAHAQCINHISYIITAISSLLSTVAIIWRGISKNISSSDPPIMTVHELDNCFIDSVTG